MANEIDLRIIARDLATSVIKGINKQISGFGSNVFKLNQALELGGRLFAPFRKGLEFIGQGFQFAARHTKNFLSVGFDVAAQMETSRAGFQVFLKDAKKVDATIDRLVKEAARTPFELPGLTQATQLLTSVTKDGDEAIDIILDVGESLAAVGKGQASLDSVIVNLQQIASAGRATSQDIRQFAFAGLPIFDLLAEKTGLAGDALSDFISDGQVSFELLTEIFQEATEEGGEFFGAFETQSGTFTQLVSNMKDTFGIFAADFVTQTGLMDKFKGGIDRVTTAMETLKEPAIELGERIITRLASAAQWAKEKFVSWWETSRYKIMPVVTDVKDAVKRLAQSLGLGSDEAGAFDGVLGALSTTLIVSVLKGFQWVVEKATDFSNWLNDNPTKVAQFKAAMDLLGQAVRIVADAFKLVFHWAGLALDQVGKFIGKADTAIGKAKSLSLAPSNFLKDKLGFAEGGIVGGSSFTGDKVMARVNSGEMILNKRQQQNLFSAISKGDMSGGGVTVNVTGNNIDSESRVDQLVGRVIEAVEAAQANRNLNTQLGMGNQF